MSRNKREGYYWGVKANWSRDFFGHITRKDKKHCRTKNQEDSLKVYHKLWRG